MNVILEARKRPGHILLSLPPISGRNGYKTLSKIDYDLTDLLPKPNATVRSGSSLSWPEGVRNRSGLKDSGSGYFVGSCSIALETVSGSFGF